MMKDDGKRITTVSEAKKRMVKDLAQRMQRNRTVFLASSSGLPGRQFHEIKKKLRSVAEMKVAKKSSIVKAIESTGKGAMQNLKPHLSTDYVVIFSDLEPFELAGLLVDYQSLRRAKAGDIAPEDIDIEPGPTELVAGPAISELSGVGLKVAVKEGKLEIIKGATVAKKGDAIKANVASVLGKLNVSPMKVGFIPVAAYDGKDEAVYTGLVIDKAGALAHLKESIRKALGFAISVEYPTEKTIRYFITKAALEEKALARKLDSQSTKEAA
jgi:large subunit ribosomal protein L10